MFTWTLLFICFFALEKKVNYKSLFYFFFHKHSNREKINNIPDRVIIIPGIRIKGIYNCKKKKIKTVFISIR